MEIKTAKTILTILLLVFMIISKAQTKSYTVLAVYDSSRVGYSSIIHFTNQSTKEPLSFTLDDQSEDEAIRKEFWDNSGSKIIKVNGVSYETHTNQKTNGRIYVLQYTSSLVSSDEGVSTVNTLISAKPMQIKSQNRDFIGCYQYKNYGTESYTIGKIPSNGAYRFDGKFIPVSKQCIGKYFISQYCSKNSTDTTALYPGSSFYEIPVHMYLGYIIEEIEDNGNIIAKTVIVGSSGMTIGREEIVFGKLSSDEKGNSFLIMNQNRTYAKVNK